MNGIFVVPHSFPGTVIPVALRPRIIHPLSPSDPRRHLELWRKRHVVQSDIQYCRVPSVTNHNDHRYLSNFNSLVFLQDFASRTTVCLPLLASDLRATGKWAGSPLPDVGKMGMRTGSADRP